LQSSDTALLIYFRLTGWPLTKVWSLPERQQTVACGHSIGAGIALARRQSGIRPTMVRWE
jgi:hypothetical protein